MNRMQRILILVCLTHALIIFGADSDKDSSLKIPSKGMIELDTIKIIGKIQEPTLLYILDQPELDIDPYEGEHIDFIEKIYESVHQKLLVNE
ncbi:MAG: hypothetical protein KDD48_00880 [Bdellovibrionales bacterium]|nr:hypothetical protein [Bdellovibrionales bacterium]